MRNLKINLLLVLLMSTLNHIHAQGISGKTQKGHLIKGKLANGLTYYIKDTQNNEDKISLRFIIKAGVLQEDESQKEVAHLLEHIAFKGTPNFPKGIKDLGIMNEMGMLRSDIGGNVSIKSTEYHFNIPRQNKIAFQNALLWFKDIAMNLPITSKNVEAEKGSIRQEHIYRESDDIVYSQAKEKIEAYFYPCFKYKANMQKHIKNIKISDIKRFYKDWYRPELMSLIVVGHIDNLEDIEKDIKSALSEIPQRKDHRTYEDCEEIYYKNPEKFKAIIIDDSSTYRINKERLNFSLFYKKPEISRNINSFEGYIDYLSFDILLKILNTRLNEVFTNNVYVKNEYKYGLKPISYSFNIDTKPLKSKEQLKKLSKLLRQLKAFGVNQNEYQKNLSNYLKHLNNSTKKLSLKNLSEHFVLNHPLIKDHEKIIRTLESMSLDDFNIFIKNNIHVVPEDIGVVVSKSVDPTLYREKNIRKYFKEVKNNLKPYKPELAVTSLISGKENFKLANYEFKKPPIEGVKEIKLENGVTLILKSFIPTDGIEKSSFKLHGFTKKGAKCYTKKDYYNALTSAQFISNENSKKLNSFKKYHHITYNQLFIDYLESGVRVGSSLNSIEAALELVYTYFMPFNYDESKYLKWKEKQRIISRDSDHVNNDLKTAIRSFHGDSTIPPTLGYRYLKGNQAISALDKSEGERSLEIYNEIFSQPDQSTFIMTGNFDLEKTLPLFQKYLGNISKRETQSLCSLISPNFKKQIKEEPVFKQITTDKKMQNVKYNLHFYKADKEEISWKNNLRLNVLGEVLKNKLSELRYEHELGLYDIWASGKYNLDQRRDELNVDISCLPEEVEIVRTKCLHIIDDLTDGKINKIDLEEAVKKIRKKHDFEYITQHGQMHKRIYENIRYHKPWVNAANYQKYLDQISVSEIIEAAQTYFKPINRYEFILKNDKDI